MSENTAVITGFGVLALFLTVGGLAYHDHFAIVFAPIFAGLFGMGIGGALMKGG